MVAQVVLSLPASAKPLDPCPCRDKSSRPSPSRASPCAFNCFSMASGVGQGLRGLSPPRRHLFTLTSLSSTLACPSSQSVRNSFCPRALALACPQAACHTSPWFPHSPQLTCHLWGGRRTVPATSLFPALFTHFSFTHNVDPSLRPSTPPWKTIPVASRGLVPGLTAPAQ